MGQEWHHTDEVILHLVQNWLHVLLSQILGSHQAFQHPKHSPETTLFGSAETPHKCTCSMSTVGAEAASSEEETQPLEAWWKDKIAVSLLPFLSVCHHNSLLLLHYFILLIWGLIIDTSQVPFHWIHLDQLEEQSY